MNLQTEKAKSQQIAETLEKEILRGSLNPGTRIQSVRALAERFQVSIKVIQTVFDVLEQKELIERRHGSGTFVKEIKLAQKEKIVLVNSALTKENLLERQPKIGIYAHVNSNEHDEDFIFINCLSSEIIAQATRKGMICQLFMDNRSREKRKTQLPELTSAVEKKTVEALIVLRSSPEARNWLTLLQQSSVSLNVHPEGCSVIQDIEAIVELAVSRLKAQDCRQVGMIGGMSPLPRLPWNTDIYTLFIRKAREAGMCCESENVISPRGSLEYANSTFGLYMMELLLNLQHRPDGIFIFPDTIAIGAISALKNSRIRIPDDLKLVIFKNEEMPLFIPFPVDLITVSLKTWAEMILNMLQLSIENHTVGNEMVPVSLVKNYSLLRTLYKTG